MCKMNKAKILEKVKADYEIIADEFDATRRQSWPEFGEFMQHFPRIKKIKILDAGCGNGRLIDFLGENGIRKIDYIGIDNGEQIIKIAKKRHPGFKFRRVDILKLPFPENFFDNIWCIAALHHIPTAALQAKALKEFKRTLKPDGILMITVWNLWQPKYKKYIHPKTRNAFIPWGQRKDIKRFYYAFKPAELSALLKSVGFIRVKKIKSKHNIAFVCHEKN